MRKFTDAALREFEIEVFGEPVDVSEDMDDLEEELVGPSDDEELQALLEEVENDLDAQEYEVITCEQLQEMVRDHERGRDVKCGTFLVENEDGTYTAAESALGCLWLEDFRTKRAAEAWLAGMDTEDAYRLDEVEDAQRRCIEHAKKTIRKEAPWILE